MKITLADWLVVAAYFLVNLLIGLHYRKKASARRVRKQVPATRFCGQAMCRSSMCDRSPAITRKWDGRDCGCSVCEGA